eukprot:6143014-Prymnesium_polylepis.1
MSETEIERPGGVRCPCAHTSGCTAPDSRYVNCQAPKTIISPLAERFIISSLGRIQLSQSTSWGQIEPRRRPSIVTEDAPASRPVLAFSMA